MPFSEDLDVYLDPVNGFATGSTYDGATSVNVIFDEAYLEQLAIAGTRPMALGKASDFPAAAVGKTLQIPAGGTVWVIKGREPIEDGAFVLLNLKTQ